MWAGCDTRYDGQFVDVSDDKDDAAPAMACFFCDDDGFPVHWRWTKVVSVPASDVLLSCLLCVLMTLYGLLLC